MKIIKILSDQGVHIQKLSYSCGPCSILNILHMKGDFSQTEESLTKLCDAKSGIGTSKGNLLKACEQIGLEVMESKKGASIEDIERNIDKGNYVIINYFDAFSEVGHYSVVVEYDKKAVYMADSGFGLMRLNKNDLLKNWYNSRATIHRWYAAIK